MAFTGSQPWLQPEDQAVGHVCERLWANSVLDSLPTVVSSKEYSWDNPVNKLAKAVDARHSTCAACHTQI